MATPIQLIRDGDLCPLCFLVILLLLIGRQFVAQSPRLSLWGLRLAAAGFLTFCAYGAWCYGAYDATDWIHILLRALVAGALMLGLSWIILPSAAFLKRLVIDMPAERAQAAASAARQRSKDQQIECQRQHQEHDQSQRELAARSATVQRQEARADAARRRTDARAQVELTFSLLAPRLTSRFPKETLADYLATYMADDQSPEDVERRGGELIAMLEKHRQEEEVAETLLNLEQLDTWFQDQNDRIQRSSAEEKLKRCLAASLNVRYAELAQRFMEDLQP